MKRALACFAAIAVLLGGLGERGAEAGPSRWESARNPEVFRRQALLDEAETLTLRYRRIRRLQRSEAAEVGKVFIHQAKDLLEEGGIGRSRDPAIRFRLAELYHLLEDDAKAIPLFESILRSSAPAPIRAEAYSSLAVSYARLGRHEDEIKAYTGALLLEPHSAPRSTLLANRAEAYMALGDIMAAVSGYREALSLLSSVEMIFLSTGTTTLWGLAVALDRSGDLDGGFAAIRIARTYDPLDKRINGPGWFYSPAHDKYYYRALGHWSAARTADEPMAKDEEYRQSIASWEEYVVVAPPEDRWAPLARARLRQCEKERDAWLRTRKQKR